MEFIRLSAGLSLVPLQVSHQTGSCETDVDVEVMEKEIQLEYGIKKKKRKSHGGKQINRETKRKREVEDG